MSLNSLQISISNSLGQIVYSQTKNSNAQNPIEITDLAGGVYFCKIVVDGGLINKTLQAVVLQ